MRPLMVLAGYAVIRTLFSGTRDMAQIYLDGSIWYIPDLEFQGLLDKMVKYGAIRSKLEGKHKILVYEWEHKGLSRYRNQFETDEYRCLVEKSKAILLDFVDQEFNKEAIIEKYKCSDEDAEFYINYLSFIGKIEYLYDNGTKTGVWVLKASFLKRVGKLLGIS